MQTFRNLHDTAQTTQTAFVIPWDTSSARMLAAMGLSALATTSAGLAFAWDIRAGTAT